MIYETYTCSMANGTLEYGFCFKANEGDDDCIDGPEIVVGVVNPNTMTSLALTRRLRRDWRKYEWMAKVICAAKEAK